MLGKTKKCIVNKTKNIFARFMPMKLKFSYIYTTNHWGGEDSISGRGSDLMQTSNIRDEIPLIIRKMNVKTLLDAPCGDFFWMKEIELYVDKYIGIDIVPELIEKNHEKYGNEKREFLLLDITEKIPLSKFDLILCRDCLVHFSFNDAFSAIKNFKKSGSKYFLTTTFPGIKENNNIITGFWRPINLELSPFNFPKPINLIMDCTAVESKSTEKYLGLWKLEDIHL